MTVSRTIKVKQGSKLQWFVRADGFQEQSGIIDSVMEHTSFPIYLIGESSTTAKLKINPTPSNATIIINEVEGGEKDIVKGTTATYTVSADRYFSITETTDRMYNDLEVPIELYGPLVLLKIQTNKEDAIIKIDGEECSEKWILQGTTANYEISLTDYETISGTTEILNEDTELAFTMRKAPYDLKTTGEWTSSGDSSNFYAPSSNSKYATSWTLTPVRRALLSYAYVQSSYWNSDYNSRIDIYFKDGTTWLSDSQGSATSSKTNGTYPSFRCSYNGSGYTRYRYYYQEGTCNPPKELTKISFSQRHWTTSADVSTYGSVNTLKGYWANTLTINTNIPATITIDNITKTDVSTYEYLVLEDEIDNIREIEYRIEADGYMPQSGTIVVDEDKTLDIVLEELYPVTFTINPTPTEATVIINGEERNTIEIMQLEEVNWSVTYDGYDSQTGSFIIYEDTVIEPTLEVAFGLWSSSTPGTYEVEVKVPGKYQLTLVGGGGGSSGYCFTNGSEYPIITTGGGAGYIQNHTVLLDIGTYTVNVGAGGSGKYGNPTSTSGNYYYAVAGGNSSISNSAYSAVAYGGNASGVYGSSSLQDTVQSASSSSASTSSFPVVTEGTFGIGQAGEEHWGRTWADKTLAGKPGLTVNGKKYGYSGTCYIWYSSGHWVRAGNGTDGYVSIEWKGFE